MSELPSDVPSKEIIDAIDEYADKRIGNCRDILLDFGLSPEQVAVLFEKEAERLRAIG